MHAQTGVSPEREGMELHQFWHQTGAHCTELLHGSAEPQFSMQDGATR